MVLFLWGAVTILPFALNTICRWELQWPYVYWYFAICVVLLTVYGFSAAEIIRAVRGQDKGDKGDEV